MSGAVENDCYRLPTNLLFQLTDFILQNEGIRLRRCAESQSENVFFSSNLDNPLWTEECLLSVE